MVAREMMRSVSMVIIVVMVMLSNIGAWKERKSHENKFVLHFYFLYIHVITK